MCAVWRMVLRVGGEGTDLGTGGWASGSQGVMMCGNLWTASLFLLFITGEAKAIAHLLLFIQITSNMMTRAIVSVRERDTAWRGCS